MLPSIAASSSGHWNQDGSRGWQRAIAARRRRADPDQHVAAEPLDEGQALAGRGRDTGVSIGPAGRPSRICSISAEALLDLARCGPRPGR